MKLSFRTRGAQDPDKSKKPKSLIKSMSQKLKIFGRSKSKLPKGGDMQSPDNNTETTFDEYGEQVQEQEQSPEQEQNIQEQEQPQVQEQPKEQEQEQKAPAQENTDPKHKRVLKHRF